MIDYERTRRMYEETLGRLREGAPPEPIGRARDALATFLARRRTNGQVYMGGESDPTPGETRAAEIYVRDLLDAGWEPPAYDMARRQEQLAEDGRAEGQCSCGSYRLDGKPPVLHRPGCEHADDWKADPLRVLGQIADDAAHREGTR